MTIISININFSLFANIFVINYFYDYSHQYAKPAFIRELTTQDCGGAQFVETSGQVPTLPSPKSGPLVTISASYRHENLCFIRYCCFEKNYQSFVYLTCKNVCI